MSMALFRCHFGCDQFSHALTQLKRSQCVKLPVRMQQKMLKKLISNFACFAFFGYFNWHSSKLCAGNVDVPGACFSDSNGSFVCQGALVGIVVFNAECTRVNYLENCTDDFYYNNWIQQRHSTFN